MHVWANSVDFHLQVQTAPNIITVFNDSFFLKVNIYFSDGNGGNGDY